MRRALEYIKKFDGVVAQHAQEPRLTQASQMNEGFVSSQLGLKGWPAIAEESIIARDVLLADHVQARLHICHVTTRGGVEIIRWAKSMKWIKLEVLNTTKGSGNDNEGTVEFKAYFKEGFVTTYIHENSYFTKENGNWVYVGEAK